MSTSLQIKQIHTLKNILGLDDDLYREMLASFGVYSSKKLTETEANSSDGTLSDEMHLVSKKSGEYKPVTVYTDPLTGKKIAPDVGWSHNPSSGLVD